MLISNHKCKGQQMDVDRLIELIELFERSIDVQRAIRIYSQSCNTCEYFELREQIDRFFLSQCDRNVLLGVDFTCVSLYGTFCVHVDAFLNALSENFPAFGFPVIVVSFRNVVFNSIENVQYRFQSEGEVDLQIIQLNYRDYLLVAYMKEGNADGSDILDVYGFLSSEEFARSPSIKQCLVDRYQFDEFPDGTIQSNFKYLPMVEVPREFSGFYLCVFLLDI